MGRLSVSARSPTVTRLTQADLARASGLSPATVSSMARALRDEGWLEEGDGRRAALALSRSAGVAVGIDFGHSHVRVAIADLVTPSWPSPRSPSTSTTPRPTGSRSRAGSCGGCSARSAPTRAA
jgi:hypothetical protein